MRTVVAFIDLWGGAAIRFYQSWTAFAAFLLRVATCALDPRTYDSATRGILFKQVYFTAVQALPAFTAYSLVITALLSQIIVSLTRSYGLAEYALDLIVRFVVMELLPFLSVLFVALRSGAAIATEVATVHVTGELKALEECGVDPVRYEFLPRVLGGMVSVFALTAMSGFITLVFAFFMLHGTEFENFAPYSQALGEIYSPPAMLGFVAKTTLFGAVVTAVPLYAGTAIPRRMFLVPVAVLNGMVRVFFAIFVIEVVSLTLKYV